MIIDLDTTYQAKILLIISSMSNSDDVTLGITRKTFLNNISRDLKLFMQLIANLQPFHA